MDLSTVKVVVTDYEYRSRQPLLDELGKVGISPVFGCCTNPGDVEALAADADGILVGGAPLPRQVIRTLRKCKAIVSFRSGVDNIDLEAAAQRGIAVSKTTEANYDEVATHAVALLLALARKVVLLDRLARSGTWSYRPVSPIRRISGRVVGIVGFGMIGRTVARKLSGFSLELLAADPFQDVEAVAAYGARLVDLEELLRLADFVTLHLPLTTASRHLIGRRELGLMKPGALLVNTARGAIIDEEALYQALVQGRLAGAALDTFEEEPPDPANPLLALDCVIVTPHCGWYSEESMEQTVSKAALRLIGLLRGETALGT